MSSKKIESGIIMHALGRVYHAEHFVCALCRAPLDTKAFYTVNQQPNCQTCYQVCDDVVLSQLFARERAQQRSGKQ
jgi:hypothetical protein